MDRLDAMRLFTRIVELASFTAAADDLNLPRATVTHTIKRLEAHLGTQLLQRTTRSVRTSRDGEAYYRHCVRLLADVDAVEADFRQAAVQPRGRLRVDLPTQLAKLWVIPALPAFFARYPMLELDIGTGDHFVDLLREGVDCVLRAGNLSDSGLVSRRVGALAQATVASAEYIRQHGMPRSIADLQNGHYAVNWAVKALLMFLLHAQAVSINRSVVVTPPSPFIGNAAAIVYLAIVLVLSHATYRYVEAPCRQRSRQLAERWFAKRAVGAVVVGSLPEVPI